MAKIGILLVFLAAVIYVEGLSIQGGQLRAIQEGEAWWDPDSKQWFIRLTCGSFSFQGNPPLNVTWTTPQGEAKFSSGYDHELGRFYLFLDYPIQGGNYSCAIPREYLPADCDEDQDNPDEVSASVEVDELKARVVLAEANQRTLEEMLEELQQRLAQDLENVTLFCQGVEISVEEHGEIIQDLQDSMGGGNENKPSNDSSSEEVELEGACKAGMYTVLDDAWRSTSNELEEGEDYYCDDDLAPGWYRFYLDGQNAVIPTSCVPDHHCQTHAPQWIDLQGESLPEVNEEKEARACANWSGDCCNWESPITVRNCGDFFVYHLMPRDTCHLAYCAEPQG